MARYFTALAVAATLLLSGCGFHLRGQVPLPESLSSVFVRGSDPDLVFTLEDALDFSGATVLEKPQGASAVVDLYDIKYRREVRKVDDRGLATGYKLVYDIEFRVVDNQGRVLLEETDMDMNRNLNFDSTQVLQAEEEEDFIKEDMQRELALRILRRLSKIPS